MISSFWNSFDTASASREHPVEVICAMGFNAIEKTLRGIWDSELKPEISELQTYVQVLLDSPEEIARLHFGMGEKISLEKIHLALNALGERYPAFPPTMETIVCAYALSQSSRWNNPIFMRWVRTLWDCATLRDACFGGSGLSRIQVIKSLEILSLARTQGQLFNPLFHTETAHKLSLAA